MSGQPAERVRAAIEDHGPFGFDEYMELALYGAGGFFDVPPVGPDEIENRAERLALRLPQPASELLKEQCWAFGRTQH